MKNVSTLIVLLVWLFTINLCARTYVWGWNNSHLRVRHDTNNGKSVVDNLQLVCEQLCSEKIGGPLCGPTKCGTYEVTNDTNKISIIHGVEDKICPVLCLNGLGVPNCACTIQSAEQKDINSVCDTFCENEIDLNGCTKCIKIIERKSESNTTTTSTTTEKTTTTTEKTTTPDWGQICVELCKLGQGGSMCNCDIPPFF